MSLLSGHTAEGVLWDIKNNRSIIYIDTCIEREDVLREIITAFEIKDYITEHDDHYRCKDCVGDLFN